VTVTGDDTAAAPAPAAWYPCPTDPRLLRWWDGAAWTDDTVDPDVVDRPAEVMGGPTPESPAADTPEEALDARAPGGARRSSRRERAARRLPETGPVRYRSTYASVEVGDTPTAPPASGVTVWSWALAGVPLVQAATLAPLLGAGAWTAVVLLAAPVVIALLLADRDRSVLASRSLRTAGWGWAAVPGVYLGIRLARVGRSSVGPLLAWAAVQLAVFVFAVVTMLPVVSAMTEEPRYERAPWATASTDILTVEQRAALLTPTGMAGQIVADLRADGSEVTDATCPPAADTADGGILTCRVVMETAEADVRLQVTDGYPTVAFVILGFDYD
jgi:hypothetical protein